MAEFKSHIDLGKTAYVVRGSLDYWVEKMTVGQVTIKRTLPKARFYDDKLYEENYMCIETGVGSGNVYEYGKNIFSTEEEAKKSVIEHQQKAYKEKANRDKYLAEQEANKREREIRLLNELKNKYESVV